MPTEGNVGEITETTRRQVYDGQTHGTGVVACTGPISNGVWPTGATKSVAFDQGMSTGKSRVRVAQPDGRVVEWR